MVLDVQADRLSTKHRRAAVLALVLGLAGCIEDRLPPSPAAATSAAEAEAAARLERHLAALPGVGGATVLVHLAPRGPFARGPATAAAPPRAAIALTAAAGADPAALADAARGAARTLLGPEAATEVHVSPPPAAAPALVQVGPFRVAAASRGPLIATLAAALLAVAALAAALARAAYRRGIRPHQSSASTTRGS